MTPEIRLISKPHGEGVTILTKIRKAKFHKLSHEILGIFVISLLLSLVLLKLLSACAVWIAESYYTAQGMINADLNITELDSRIFNLSLLISVIFFVLLFLILLGERLSYIRKLIKGVDALRMGEENYILPLKGNNELTQLAEAINYMSATQREIRKKELALSKEKEQFFRSLSHDIRTPLTSILSYSELLTSGDGYSPEEQKAYLELIQKKAQQIKELTDVFLSGGQRSPELFDDARLLMEQLAGEFEESLEDDFKIITDLSGCSAFSGTFDIRELQRIFDNLISNIKKYADYEKAVTLKISYDNALIIHQENAVRPQTTQAESFQIGLNSIRRIVHNYGGQVDIQSEADIFAITITLSEI